MVLHTNTPKLRLQGACLVFRLFPLKIWSCPLAERTSFYGLFLQGRTRPLWLTLSDVFHRLLLLRCIYNVTFRSVRITIVLPYKNNKYIFWVCICSVSYSACNAIFPHYLINGPILEKKKLLNTKCVFWYSLQLLSETFLILKWIQPDVIINMHWSSCKVPDILVRF